MSQGGSADARLSATGGERKVVILSKKGCHLCEAVEAEVRSITSAAKSIVVVDIDEDSGLHGRYWLRVPVVRVGGEDVFEAKMMDREGEWKKSLARLLEEEDTRDHVLAGK
jgi:CO dehydrogenase nickel-insertion accessory protein CooC1